MGKFGKKETEIQRLGGKLTENSLKFGRKAGDAMERLGPMITVAGMASGNPVLTTTGAITTAGGKAVSGLLRKN